MSIGLILKLRLKFTTILAEDLKQSHGRVVVSFILCLNNSFSLLVTFFFFRFILCVIFLLRFFIFLFALSLCFFLFLGLLIIQFDVFDTPMEVNDLLVHASYARIRKHILFKRAKDFTRLTKFQLQSNQFLDDTYRQPHPTVLWQRQLVLRDFNWSLSFTLLLFLNFLWFLSIFPFPFSISFCHI